MLVEPGADLAWVQWVQLNPRKSGEEKRKIDRIPKQKIQYNCSARSYIRVLIFGSMVVGPQTLALAYQRAGSNPT